MAENGFLTSPVAYDILALLHHGDEIETWTELLDTLDVDSSTLSKNTA